MKLRKQHLQAEALKLLSPYDDLLARWYPHRTEIGWRFERRYILLEKEYARFFSANQKVNTEMKSKVEVPKEQRDLQFAMATATSLQPATSADLWTREMVELQHEVS